MYKRIIICGYPKSGNTWLTRLTAEILRCPSVGFWCNPKNKDECIEGLDRKSDHHCFKSHASYEQLQRSLELYGNGTEKIVYVYRDPRAIAVSASHYYRLKPEHPKRHALLQLFPKGRELYNKCYDPKAYTLKRLTKGVIKGIGMAPWMKVPWKEHLEGYIDREHVHTVSYEALSADPLSCCRELARFLGIERSDEELEQAIDAQSFSKKKKQFDPQTQPRQAKLMRSGRRDSWKDELPDDQIKMLETHLGEFMQQLSYGLVFPKRKPRPDSKPS